MNKKQKPFYEEGWHINEDKQCYEMFVFDEVVASISAKEIEDTFISIGDLMGIKKREAQKRFKDKYIEELQKDLIGNLRPIYPATEDWMKVHAKADLIEYNKIEEDDGMTRMIPFRAIYKSPIAKFQEIMKAKHVE